MTDDRLVDYDAVPLEPCPEGMAEAEAFMYSHDYQPVGEWEQRSDPLTGEPSGPEYRRLTCTRCGDPLDEARHPE